MTAAVPSSATVQSEVLDECRALLPGWAELTPADVHFEPPKGFSSFTMVLRPRVPVDPPGVLYRRLEGKENAILDGPMERNVFLALGEAGIAARCLHHDPNRRLEELYSGRTLTGRELFDPEILRKIAAPLYRLHHMEPPPLPSRSFFELLHDKWGPQARSVLENQRDAFPESERRLCDELTAIYSDQTAERVRRCLPDGPLTFCHNDTYHGNIMKLDDGSIRLLDFEFSCMGHRAFDFANLFAETVMRHGLPDPPYFGIAAPEFGRKEIATLVGFYLDHATFRSPAARRGETDRLVEETLGMVRLSDYMYAMAALPLAVEPIQKIRFLPYAHARFRRFLASTDAPTPR